jgi:hypothetical protein
MTESTARRRGHGEDAIYFDATKNRYVGAVSLGFGPDGKRSRRKVSGRTKQEVRDKLKALHAELDRGLRTSAAYTIQRAVDDWLEGELPGRSDRTRSVDREALTPLMGQIGAKPLRELTAGDVRGGLEALSGRLSSRYLQIAKASLARAIRFAEAHDLVGRNVATLVDPPKGTGGRPSRSLSLEQSLALLDAARQSRLNAYVVLSLTVGIRTEEARELRWDRVDLDGDPGAREPSSPASCCSASTRVRSPGRCGTSSTRRTPGPTRCCASALCFTLRPRGHGMSWRCPGAVIRASCCRSHLRAAGLSPKLRRVRGTRSADTRRQRPRPWRRFPGRRRSGSASRPRGDSG